MIFIKSENNTSPRFHDKVPGLYLVMFQLWGSVACGDITHRTLFNMKWQQKQLNIYKQRKQLKIGTIKLLHWYFAVHQVHFVPHTYIHDYIVLHLSSRWTKVGLYSTTDSQQSTLTPTRMTFSRFSGLHSGTATSRGAKSLETNTEVWHQAIQ